MALHYISGICGSGKTHYALTIIKANQQSIYCCPSILLQDEIEKNKLDVRFVTFNSKQSNDGVSLAIQQHMNYDVLPASITHEGFFNVTDWSSASRWTLFVDEAFQPVVALPLFNAATTASKQATLDIIQAMCSITTIGNRIIFKPKAPCADNIRRLANGTYDDMNFNNKNLTAYFGYLNSPNYTLSVSLADWLSFKMAASRICIHADFNLDIFSRFKDVYFISAGFENSFLYNWAAKNGVHIEPDTNFKPRISAHVEAVHGYYGFGDVSKLWSKNFFNKTNNTGKSNLTSYINAVALHVGKRLVLTSINNGNKWPASMNIEAVKSNCEGLNNYDHMAIAALGAAYNWAPEFIDSLKGRGFDVDQQLRNNELEKAYQIMLRTAIRKGGAIEVYAPTASLLERLQQRSFPNMVIKQLPGMQFVKPIQKRAPMTAAERMKNCRARKKQMAKLGVTGGLN